VDLYALLKQDHGRVKELFAKLERSAGAEERDRLFQTLKLELMAHKEAEDATFYAALSVLPEISDRIEEALEEHVDIEELLEEFDGIEGEGEVFTAQLVELREEVQHHVEREEEELFPRARELLSEAQSARIARDFATAKERLAAQFG
jgi:hemerythrin-like domain-containing protein